MALWVRLVTTSREEPCLAASMSSTVLMARVSTEILLAFSMISGGTVLVCNRWISMVSLD